jgi:hypothetical protein
MEQGSNRRFASSFDFEEGREAEIELQGGDSLWIAAGPGITCADVWMKDVKEPGIDLRIRIRRDPTGIEIAVDRGEGRGRWWPDEGPPRLQISLNTSRGMAAATATAATAGEAFLGEIPI